MNISMNKKTAGIIAVLAGLLIIIALFIYFFHTPEFPDSVPSAEKVSIQEENYQKKKAFFDTFTRYIRENHGGIIQAEEITRTAADPEDKDISYVVFRHKYKYLNTDLLFKLINNFAKNDRIAYKIKRYSYQNIDKDKPDTYEVIFSRETHPWVAVKLEWANEYLSREQQRIQYIEMTEEIKVDQEEPAIQPKNGPRLVIILDDFGNNMEVFEKLIELDYPITYSILPQLPHSLETAERVNKAGYDVMLHLPMQPRDWPKYNPGVGALMIEDDAETIQRKMSENLQSVPYIVGVNNHMGSAYTQYSEGLDILMGILKEKNLFFVDSKTSPGNIAKNSAKRNDVLYLSRNIFLDNIQNEEYVSGQLAKAVRFARKYGTAIAIGHPYYVTYDVLSRQLPEIEREGILITRISDLL